ncbi:MAG: hypothetical protein WB809_05525 [Thermoplasmata archaeon]
MSGPRAVRIPRSRGERPRVEVVRPAAISGRRPNRAGTQRAVRTTIVYVTVVLALTLVLTALDLASAEASHPGVEQGLELFLAVAALLIIGSAIFALSPAPRYVEVGEQEVVVIGRWGTRRTFGPLSGLAPRVVKHFPDGVLSTRAVDLVEITDQLGRRRAYEVESGLFDPE